MAVNPEPWTAPFSPALVPCLGRRRSVPLLTHVSAPLDCRLFPAVPELHHNAGVNSFNETIYWVIWARKRAQRVLRADTETEAIERALDFVIAEHERNRLTVEANDCFVTSGIDI